MEKRAKTAVPFGPGPVKYYIVSAGNETTRSDSNESLPRNRPRDTPKAVYPRR